jgi:hypothetical protein
MTLLNVLRQIPTSLVDSITAKNVANPGSATRQTLAQAGKVASR